MNRVLLIFFAVFALVARSDGELKCYVCDSLTDPDCGDPSKKDSPQTVPCDNTNLRNLYRQLESRNDLSHIAKLFEIDNPQSMKDHLVDFACAKMNIKLGPKNVTVRSCQSAKTKTIDPCRAVETKLSHMQLNAASISFCDLCNTDGCNGAIDVAAPNIIPLLIGSLGLMMFQAFRQHFA